MPYFFYGYDPYYWMILIPAMLIALFAQLKVSSTFNRYDRVRSARGYTGAQAAEAVLRQHGVTDVRIERVRGRLTDHYDPRSNVIRLSDAVYASNSVAAMGVAAHEAGHAVQYAVGYGPIRLRNAIIPVCNFGSQLSILLIVIGIMVLYEVCKPFDWKRRVLWGAMAGSSAVTILGFGGSFGLSPLGTQAFLVLLVFLGLAYSIMRFMLGLFDQGERLLNRGRHLRKRR